MLDEPADSTQSAQTPEPNNNSKVSWERSSIGFPYAPLAEGLEVASAIQGSVGTGIMSDDQLAPAIGMSHKSSGYRTKISAARMFGLIEAGDGGHRLSDLGKRVVDEKQARAAKADAFLNVPLYRRVYEEHKGSTIPPAAALEREFLGFGVAPKQTTRARQVFERSAEQAGYFEIGKDRLVRPPVKEGDTTVTKEDKTKHGGGGGGGDDYGDLDPLIAGLLRRMPKAGEAWPVAERARWLQTLAMNLSFIHADKPSDPTIDVIVKRATVPPPPPSELSVQDVMS